MSEVKTAQELLGVPLEKGMYEEARGQNVPFSEFIHNLALDKGTITPDDKFHAFERLLKAFDIRVSGPTAHTVNSFYKVEESPVLFPEWINRQVKIGMLIGKNTAHMEDLVSTEFSIDSNVYKDISLDPVTQATRMKRVAEYAEFPGFKITHKEKAITIRKIGQALDISYEVLRRIKIPLVAQHLQMVGLHLAADMATEAIRVAINGDGNMNPAITTAVATPGTLLFADLIDWTLEFDPHDSSLWIMSKALIGKCLRMEEFHKAGMGSTFPRTGEWITPFGNVMKRHTAVTAGHILGCDQDFGLEKITEAGSELTESTYRSALQTWRRNG
ncbi:hypothetical protein ES703_09168 [subsurface metagenome]